MDNEYLKKIKKNTSKKEKKYQYEGLMNYISKFLITIIITISTLIILKANPKLKTGFYEKVYEDNISFAKINSIYEKYFGSALPFKDYLNFLEPAEPVFNEKLTYTESNEYLEGVKITVGENYLIPCIETGLVVFIGEKENYGNTVVIEQQDGTTVWYSNLKSISVKLYDYVKIGSFIGENKDNFMYLVFKKEGNVIDYKNYI